MGTSGEGEATGGRAVSTQREVLGTQHLKPKVQTPYVGKFVPSHRVLGVESVIRRQESRDSGRPTQALARER